jgi:hypothetical protein
MSIHSYHRSSTLAIALALALPSQAFAGMPSLGLSEIVRLRLETISFFLVAFLICSKLVQWIWNGLRRDFSRLPRLSYSRALMLVGIWGLAFVLVLTMISGARELMTPGAWKKDGLTYKLADQIPPPAPAIDPARTVALDRLRASLWQYAETHGAQFPTDRASSGIPDELWRIPDPSALHYVYVPGRKIDAGPVPLAYEPGLFGPERLVLKADGTIQAMTLDQIQRDLPKEGPR